MAFLRPKKTDFMLCETNHGVRCTNQTFHVWEGELLSPRSGLKDTHPYYEQTDKLQRNPDDPLHLQSNLR